MQYSGAFSEGQSLRTVVCLCPLKAEVVEGALCCVVVGQVLCSSAPTHCTNSSDIAVQRQLDENFLIIRTGIITYYFETLRAWKQVHQTAPRSEGQGTK